MSGCDNCGQPIETSDSSATSLCEPCTTLLERTPPIHVAPIDSADLELMLAWRSNPEIYHHFRRQDSPLDWDDHLSWYESRDTDRYDFIIHYDGRRVGVVSISATEEIGIYLGDFSAHGQGVATVALKWICERFENRAPLIAEVHEDNSPSKRLFEACGFQQRGRDDEWIKYSYEP